MLIAYRDYFKDATLTTPGGGYALFQAGAPMTNLQDRRLAVSAIASDNGGLSTVKVVATWATDVSVRLLAVLAHNMTHIDTASISFEGFSGPNETGSSIFNYTGGTWWTPPDNSQLPRNTFQDLGREYTIRSLTFSYHGDVIGDLVWYAGRIWAGPCWSPAKTTARRDFNIQTKDDSVVNRSIGQQVYADYKPRYRQLTCTLPYLTETEAIGEDTGATQNLQDIGFEVGRGGEVIVIPSTDNNQVIHKLGLYGHFLEAPAPRLIEESNADRAYSSTFDVIEDL